MARQAALGIVPLFVVGVVYEALLQTANQLATIADCKFHVVVSDDQAYLHLQM